MRRRKDSKKQMEGHGEKTRSTSSGVVRPCIRVFVYPLSVIYPRACQASRDPAAVHGTASSWRDRGATHTLHMPARAQHGSETEAQHNRVCYARRGYE